MMDHLIDNFAPSARSAEHHLMTPMFTPANSGCGAPGIILAAVGPLMTEVAGEVANAVIAHGFTTVDYLRDVTLPAVQRGLADTWMCTLETTDTQLQRQLVTAVQKA